MTKKQKVANGVKVLDKKMPGWASKINKKKFNLHSNPNCILGQLFKKKPEKGLVALGLVKDLELESTDAVAIKHGFLSIEHDDDFNELWLKEIEKRTTKKK
jgi:hypothetical protein